MDERYSRLQSERLPWRPDMVTTKDDASNAASQDTPPMSQQMGNNNPTFFNINISDGNNSFYQHVDKLTINNGGKQDE